MSRANCPRCKGLLEDDGTCSCGYGVKQRQTEQSKREADAGIQCAWEDHGRRCPSRWVTNGYCREHYERVQGMPVGGVGNYRPALAPRSIHMHQWDGWWEEWLAKRQQADMKRAKEFEPDTLDSTNRTML